MALCTLDVNLEAISADIVIQCLLISVIITSRAYHSIVDWFGLGILSVVSTKSVHKIHSTLESLH